MPIPAPLSCSLHADRATSIACFFSRHLIGAGVDLLQTNALHLQFHPRVLLEDLRVALAKHLCHPLVRYPSGTEPAGIDGVKIVEMRKSGTLAPQGGMPGAFQSSLMSARVLIAGKQIQTAGRQSHLITERFECQRCQRYLGHSVRSLGIRNPNHRVRKIIRFRGPQAQNDKPETIYPDEKTLLPDTGAAAERLLRGNLPSNVLRRISSVRPGSFLLIPASSMGRSWHRSWNSMIFLDDDPDKEKSCSASLLIAAALPQMWIRPSRVTHRPVQARLIGMALATHADGHNRSRQKKFGAQNHEQCVGSGPTPLI